MYDTHETLSDARDASAAADIVRDTSGNPVADTPGENSSCPAQSQARGRGKSRPSSLGQDQNSTAGTHQGLHARLTNDPHRRGDLPACR